MQSKFLIQKTPVLIDWQSRCRIPQGYKAQMVRATQATLKAIPTSTFKRLKISGSHPRLLNLNVVGKARMHQLNRDYRGKDRPTDVLAFSQLEGMVSPQADIGDVVICWPVAQKQAKEYGSTLKEEMARLTVHGVLHLFGYDHERSKKDEKIMFTLQEKILKRL